jgi:hypothetical protein
MAPQVYRRVVGPRNVQPQDELVVIAATNTQVFKALHPKVRSTIASFETGMVPQMPSVECKSTRFPLCLSCDNVGPNDGHRRPGVDGYTAWLVLYPALGDQAVIAPFG